MKDPAEIFERDVAVLTGDVVRSSKWSGSERALLHDAISTVSAEIQQYFSPSIPYEIDLFRGDSWQLLVSEPGQALRVALFFRARLRSRLDAAKVDSRIAIGVGSVDFLPESGVSTGDGDAFRRSGWAFEELGRSFRMAFSAEGETARCLNVVVRLVDHPAAFWTPRQAYAISQALLGLTQEQIAESWVDRPITQQAVAQHLARAGWHAVDTAVTFFEESITGATPG